MKRLLQGIEYSTEHKVMAGKFFVGWLAFLVADALWLDALVGWLKVTTHVFLAGGAALSFLFWLPFPL